MEETGETLAQSLRHDDDAIVIAWADCANPLRSMDQIDHAGLLSNTRVSFPTRGAAAPGPAPSS